MIIDCYNLNERVHKERMHMPKIFKNAKEHILKVSEEIINEKGFDALTIRDVAKRSGYGVGTIYNYFSTKISILASLVLEEWQEDEKVLNEKIEKSPTFLDSIKEVYLQINNFFQKHRELFFSVNIPKEIRGKVRFGHEAFLREIEKKIIMCQDRFAVSSNENERYAACILLIQATTVYETPFENIYDSLEKLLTGGKK